MKLKNALLVLVAFVAAGCGGGLAPTGADSSTPDSTRPATTAPQPSQAPPRLPCVPGASDRGFNPTYANPEPNAGEASVLGTQTPVPMPTAH